MIHNRLVLIDSFALIYRAFYGIPPSLTHDGHPINAAYGFASAVLSSIKELHPEYLVAAFDLPKPTKRKQEYAEYKAHRKPMPDDLIPQIQYCKKILEAMNIPIVAAEGYEGEDVIATIVAKVKGDSLKVTGKKPQTSNLKPENLESIIVTGDSDTFQLIDKTTRVYSMARGANQAVMYDIEKVKERYGLTPKEFVDYKALKGDASDNIPGVPGIGEKGAAKLIVEFGSLQELFENLEKISEKYRKILTENKEQAVLSQKLSQIECCAPIEFKLSSAKVHDYDVKKVVKLFNELGFKSLVNRLPDSHRINSQQALF